MLCKCLHVIRLDPINESRQSEEMTFSFRAVTNIYFRSCSNEAVIIQRCISLGLGYANIVRLRHFLIHPYLRKV